MKTKLAFSVTIFCFFVMNGMAMANPVSDSDLWQNATISDFSSEYSNGYLSRFFDGKEGGYKDETGNALFGDRGSAGTTHWVEWSTDQVVTIRSINLLAYHDFDEFDINDRGFSAFSLYYRNENGSWISFYNWVYTDPNDDLHYGGGPSHQSDPDNHDLIRSYLELTDNLETPIEAQSFRGEFIQYYKNGPRIVELDACGDFQSVPVPTTLLLLGSGLIGLAGFGRHFRKK